MNSIKKLIQKYIGKIQYIVTIINVDLSIQKHQFSTIQQVDEFVNEVNNTPYWMVQKIEKIRTYNFIYNKQILHSPLWVQADGVTEMHNIETYDFSFLKQDKSLINIIRLEK